MYSPLPTDLIQHTLNQFFTDPVITNARFFKMGVENITGAIEGNFGTVVLRVWGERHSRMGVRKESDIKGELAFMDACRSQGLPIPKVYASLAGHQFETLPDGRKFIFMDYVEGDEPLRFTQPMIEALAKAVARMNVLGQTFTFPAPRSWQGTVVDLAQERIAEYQAKGGRDEFVEYLAHNLPAINAKPCALNRIIPLKQRPTFLICRYLSLKNLTCLRMIGAMKPIFEQFMYKTCGRKSITWILNSLPPVLIK